MKNIQKFFPTSLVVIFCLFISYHCGINIFTDADDIKLGKQLDEQIRKNPKEYPILEGRPEVKQYVMEVGNKILGSPEIEKKGIYAYQYEIIHNDSVVNAFCTPGGYIYVYTGLLKFVDNEATLAGVMGHEIAHAERRHATKRITKAYGAQILLSIALGQSPSQVADISANLFTGLALLANSRGDETEADNYSMKYLASTSYYPGGITYFFEKIQGEKGKSGGGTIDRFLSTHPLPQDRIENVNNNLNLIGNPTPSEANLFRDRYQMFKKKLP